MTEYTSIENVLPSPEDSRDYVYQPITTKATSPVVDLIPHIHEVEHQGSTNSCTANAGCTALEILYSRAGNWNDLSRMYLYWYTRKLGNLPSSDAGAYPRDICKALSLYGVPLENKWPFIKENISREPSSLVRDNAKDYKIEEYRKVIADIDDIRNAVLNGLPVLTTIKTRSGVYSLKGDWRTHTWDSRAKNNGNHEVVIVGFCDQTERFLVQNSWGKGWGDGGFFGIPYDKVGTAKDAFEFWVITNPGFFVVPFEDAEILDADYYDPSEYEDKYVAPRKDYRNFPVIETVKPEVILDVPEPKPIEKKESTRAVNAIDYLGIAFAIGIILYFFLK